MSRALRLGRGLALLWLAAALPSAFGDSLRLLRVTPDGDDVETGSQIVLSFDRAVVPLGRMERRPDEVPVRLTPNVACEWRWIDPQSLACQLGEGKALTPATRYAIEVRPEFVTDKGEKLAQGLTQTFVTKRPALRYSGVVGWASPGVPVLQLYFNQPVSAASVARAVTAEGAAVEVRPEVHDRETPWYLPATDGEPAGEARRRWIVQPKKALAADRESRLVIGPGLRSAFGAEPGIGPRDSSRFRSWGAFRFVGLRCYDAARKDSVVLPPDRVANGLCDPLSPAALLFTAPVAQKTAAKALAITPDPSGGRKDYDPWANAEEQANLRRDHVDNEPVAVTLPFTMRADAEYHIAGGADLQDAFGRALGRRIDFRFRTAHRSPAIHFEHTTAVLEQGVDSEVPVIVTNLAKLVTDYTRVGVDGAEHGQHAERPVAKVDDLAFAMPLDVRGMLGGKAGVVDGGLTTDPSTSPKPIRYFAEVTPWQLHVKLGHYGTLVWVTEFASGKPVAGATVELYHADADWQPKPGAPSAATSDDAGVAELPGTETLDPELETFRWNAKERLAVRVRRGADFAILPLTHDFDVDIYRASRYQVYAAARRQYGHLKSWGTTAQGVYRAGDTIQYKVYVRNDASRALAPARTGPYTLRVYDPADQVVHERRDLTLSEFGAIAGEFATAKQAKVGWYRFRLIPQFAKPEAGKHPAGTGDADDEEDNEEDVLDPMRVLVSDFTPAPFKLAAEIRAKRAEPGVAFTAALRASLHAGGPFGGAPASLSAQIVAAAFEPQDPLAAKFQFGAYDGADARDQRTIAEKKAATDGAGEFSAELTPPVNDIAYGRLVVEASVQDDRGRAIAATASVPYAGRDRYVGLRSADWLLTQGKASKVETIVVDGEGRPVAGSPVYTRIERREVTVARVKDVGNVYVARYSERWLSLRTCKARSTTEPAACAFTPDAGGVYRVTASTRDTKNRLHSSSTWLWASGKNSFLWEEPDDYGLELVPDRKLYHVGDSARFLVKNPYPGATALITTERYGVIDRRTQVLEGSAPVVEIKITPDLLPGFYLSVVVQSPRVAAPPPEADVDLGKPTFRMGYAKVVVEDPYKKIAVKVSADKAGYKPRETAKVSLLATPNQATKEPIELAVAVLDEAVYDLIQGGDSYFDPYAGFTRLDALDLSNYSLLTRLVGRQKFEKKGATPGGDGGADLSLRSIDKYVAYWNPSLLTDASGRATFEFKLPDNLTAWKVLVLATTPSDRLGLGSGKLIATRDTELRPLLPNQVTAGDRFRAGFSVMNRADGPRTLNLSIEASGAASGRHSETVALKPFERRTVDLEVEAAGAADNSAGAIAFTATAGDAKDQDGLKVSVPVRPRRPTVTAADFGFLDAGDYHQSILVPEASLPGGAISVSFTPTVLGNLDGAFAYVRDYPYWCWEQRLTKGVMAANFLALKSYLDPKLVWPDADAQIKQVLADAASFQATSGGMTFWDGDEAHVSPYLSAYTALAFEWLRAAGHAPPEAVVAKLDGYLDGLLKREVQDYSLEASSTIRAVALAALAERGRLAAADLDRYLPSAPRMGLFGQTLFLQAAAKTRGGDAAVQRLLALVLAHGQASAGTLVLKETDDDFWSMVLGSPLRSNCTALSALAALPALDRDASLTELPARLVRAITQARGGRDHWENTQENVFCLSALSAYAKRWEAQTPTITMRAALDAKPIGEAAKFTSLRDAPVTLTHPIVAADIGLKQMLGITHEGAGRGYFAARVSYVERDENAKAANAGLELHRSYTVKRDGRWQPLSTEPGEAMTIRRGELVRIELRLSSPSARSFVVVDDPVPGGLEPVNPDLATASGLAAEEAAPPGSAFPYPFYHRELRFEAARWFADELESGAYKLYWIGQAVASGEFAIPAAHAEAMYDPDIFGNDVPARLVVEEVPPPAAR